jgi:hypothetical protein
MYNKDFFWNAFIFRRAAEREPGISNFQLLEGNVIGTGCGKTFIPLLRTEFAK